MQSRRISLFMLFIAATLLLAACDSGTSSSVSRPTPAASRKVHVVMGYIANVQFAPYYMALDKGYYQQAGLEVNFDYGQVNDALALLGQGKADFVIASGDEVLVARDKGVPAVYVMAQYQHYPLAVFSKAEKNITKPSDLVGKKVGIPGHYGSSYTGLQAMLYANKIAEKEVNIMDINYTQAQSVATGQVDAAVGYAMNEPIALQQQGIKLNIMQVSDVYDLASVGLVTSEQMISADSGTVQAFVSATMRGLAEANKNPDAAFAIVGKYVKEAADPANAAFQKASLAATIKFQQPTKGQVGQIDLAVWQATAKFLTDMGAIKSADVTKAYTTQFLGSQNSLLLR